MLSNTFSRLLREPVGNNLENDQEDIVQTKENFKSLGRYNSDTQNGYMDHELRDAITAYQKEHNLKVDGKMLPGIAGKSAQEAWEKWQNSSTKAREDTIDKYECDRMFERETKLCDQHRKNKGETAGKICRESAFDRYSKCLAGKPKDDWPDLKLY